MPRLACLVFSTIAIAGFSAGDWPQFRGADTTGVAADSDAPMSIGEPTACTADVPGRGLSGPIVVGSRVVVSAWSGYSQDRLHLVCFDADSGRKRWERQFWATGRTLCHEKMCNATPTPASDGQRI